MRHSLPPLNEAKIAVIGLGYVGLPLAVAFGREFPVVGFDISSERIAELAAGIERTLEMRPEEIAEARYLSYTDKVADLADCNVFVVTVPTPVDAFNRPDLRPLLSATETVARALKPRAVVIYESTVYPGATEEECVPLLENLSGLTFNEGFFVGYSPERINPGDREHRLETIVKVTSGSTDEAAEFVDSLYRRITTAGTHKAPSIQVAEAAKVIENTQRDVNIALMNELAILFGKLGIDTAAVLEAAGTKWNFLPFRPGLVGGHCIGVDPYYLTHKAQQVGYHPEVILSGRRINDGMGKHIASEAVKAMSRRKIPVAGARILVMGLTFKENCPDLRNTRVVDIVDELTQYGCHVDVHDPWASAAEAKAEYGIDLVNKLESATYDAVLVAVAHSQFADMDVPAIRALGKANHLLYDIKSLFPAHLTDHRL